MFSKFSVFVTSVLITLAAAIPAITPPLAPRASSAQCCQRIIPADSEEAMMIHILLGISFVGVDNVGLGCSPSTVIGNCAGLSVTCDDLSQKELRGVIELNCFPESGPE
ncbi:hypothetical protein DFH09DRAFT_1304339 [Mycena vulgaris]|nr:hypothetical protein DFH09DRAFT_1304339 [Mycena vulgaris]